VILEASVDGQSLRLELRRRGDRYAVSLDGRPLDVDLVETADGFTTLLVDGRSHELVLEPEPEPEATRVHFAGGSLRVALLSAAAGLAAPVHRRAGPLRLTAPMPGRVEVGQGLVVVEAMKMQNELRAPRGGRVQEIAVREGQAVETGMLLLVVT
jgi:biotin carboxyl carrier protein